MQKCKNTFKQAVIDSTGEEHNGVINAASNDIAKAMKQVYTVKIQADRVTEVGDPFDTLPNKRFEGKVRITGLQAALTSEHLSHYYNADTGMLTVYITKPVHHPSIGLPSSSSPPKNNSTNNASR